jgi:cell division septal protein FtsQ
LKKYKESDILKIFSKHRKKLDAHRRYGGREFKEKLNVAKNHKRSLNGNTKPFNLNFFGRTGFTKVGTISGLALVGTIFYFLALSPYFLVTNVSVSGNKLVTTDEIASFIKNLQGRRFLLVPQNSFFLVSQARIQAQASRALPMLREVKVDRHWPDKVSIRVTERTPAMVIVSRDKNFLIDDQGFAIKELVGPTNEFKLIDQVNDDMRVGQTIEGKLIPFILSMQKTWPTKLNVAIALAKVPGKAAAEVEFVSSEGWSVFFSTDRPVSNQVANLATLINKQISANDRDKLAYIDLRLAKRAFFCLKNTPCQQTDQSALPETAGSSKVNTVTPTTP